jgi:hypothetical protein
VITRINGLPVTESKEVLAAIERFGADKQAMMVEFVAKEQVRAIEFRLK